LKKIKKRIEEKKLGKRIISKMYSPDPIHGVLPKLSESTQKYPVIVLSKKGLVNMSLERDKQIESNQLYLSA
jgi:hypothetical protein